MSNPVCLVSGSAVALALQQWSILPAMATMSWSTITRAGERGEAVAEHIRAEYGTETLLLGADLSQPEAAFTLVDQTYAHFGRLDVCISNSGVANYVAGEDGNLLRYRFKDTPIDHLDREMERVMSLNLMGAYRLGQRSLHYMIEQAEAETNRNEAMQHRSILFITSISDIAPESTRIPYGVSKSGLNHVVLGAALDGGPFNITVNKACGQA